MADSRPLAASGRPTDLARLALSKLRIEDGLTLETLFRRLTEIAAVILNIERVGVWLMVDQRRALRCADLFERSKAAHSSGATLQVADFPDYFAALHRRKTVPAEAAQTDPRTSKLADAYLKVLDISSLLDAPVIVDHEVIGVVCHEHVGPPREWTTEERDFAGSMADIVAFKIRTAEWHDARVALRTQANQLAEARRLDALAEMAAGLAHDFNNIMTVMIGGAEIIAANATAPATVTEHAQQIIQAGKRGMAMARELTSFARPGPQSSRVVRPAEVVKAQLPLLQTMVRDRHKINLQLGSAAGRVLVAPDQLERLMLNLIVNARDAMPDGGTIDVTVDVVDDVDEDGKPGHFVLIAVRDHGVGIAPDVLPRIFDPFYSTKPRGQGTGLGLAVVNRILGYAGGFIRVDTAVGQGSTFRVYLPRVSSQN